jgi:hypothetical protein
VADEHPEPSERRERSRPVVPLAVVIVSILVAVAAVSALIFVLFKSTTGPGQELRHYYEKVTDGDCEAAYAELSSRLRSRTEEKNFCVEIHALPVPTSIEIKSVTGFGEPPARFALVTVIEQGQGAASHPLTWKMVREGSVWRIALFPEDTNAGCPCPGV